MSSTPITPITRAVTVPVGQRRAFAHFVGDFAAWWPQAYTWSGEVLKQIGIEQRAGGHCFEIGPGDFRLDWGTVLFYEPGERLTFTWQINPDRTPQPNIERAGVVELLFKPDPDQPLFTRAHLEHRGFERCPGDGAAYRDALNSDEGWTYILASYAGYCTLPLED